MSGSPKSQSRKRTLVSAGVSAGDEYERFGEETEDVNDEPGQEGSMLMSTGVLWKLLGAQPLLAFWGKDRLDTRSKRSRRAHR